MSTTRIFGNSPFEVYLQPTNKIEIKTSLADSNITIGSVVAYSGGKLVLANAADRTKSSVVGVVTALSNGNYTVVTQGFIANATIKGINGTQELGSVFYLSETTAGSVKSTPPVALGTTRIPIVQVVDGGYHILGMPGIVNGISYRGYVNISAIQPVGTVSPFIGNTTLIPKNWLLCDGSYVSIDSYPELYRLIGSVYGEVIDGRFKLPDFRGRTLVGAGAAQNLTTRFIGEFGGEEKHTLSVAEMPTHSHKPAVTDTGGVDHWWGSDDRVGSPNFDYDGTSATKPADGFIAPSYKTDAVGGNSPHNNMPPYSVANWIIRAKAESEFALLDVNVESLTNVDKTDIPESGDLIRFDGAEWKFVSNKLSNLVDLTIDTDTVSADDVVVVDEIDGDSITFKTISPSGSNIYTNTTANLIHKNGSPRPSALVTPLTGTSAPLGRKGIVHLHGSIEIEPNPGSTDGTVNINLVGFGGTTGLDTIDTITLPHYANGSNKIKIPFHATIAAQIYQATVNGTTTPAFKFSYYLSTATGSQFKPNILTINNIKFVY
jgi:microcystin-dependent protein